MGDVAQHIRYTLLLLLGVHEFNIMTNRVYDVIFICRTMALVICDFLQQAQPKISGTKQQTTKDDETAWRR